MKIKVLQKGNSNGTGSQVFACDFVIDEPPQMIWKDKKTK